MTKVRTVCLADVKPARFALGAITITPLEFEDAIADALSDPSFTFEQRVIRIQEIAKASLKILPSEEP